MARAAGKLIFRLWATCAIALSKQADQAAANSCSGLVPIRAEPGVESLMSRRPSELREAPLSRPPVVRVLAVYTSFPLLFIVHSFQRLVRELRQTRTVRTDLSAGVDQVAAISTTAWAKACGASCGRLCPIPPVMCLCSYFPENLFA